MKNPYDFEELEISSTALGFTTSKLYPENSEPCERILISPVDDAIRFRYDGGDPTDTLGYLLEKEERAFIEGWESIVKFKAIRVTNDVRLMVTYER